MVLQMPAELLARARMLAAGGPWDPPPTRDAATVVLLRDGPAGLEVLLMRRPDSMAFAPGMHVFPGGRVDMPQDGMPPIRGALPAGAWAGEALAAALIVAGVRETFEEAGVLLAVDRAGRPAAHDENWAVDRLASETAAGFPAMLQRRRLHIQADLLVPLAHWVTPEVETRRFDTRFLVAALPDGQDVDAHATETASAHWHAPSDALAEHRLGRLAMLPPTVAVLADLAVHPSVVDAMGWARTQEVVPLMPRAGMTGGLLRWELVHAYTGEVLAVADEPAGSEERGVR